MRLELVHSTIFLFNFLYSVGQSKPSFVFFFPAEIEKYMLALLQHIVLWKYKAATIPQKLFPKNVGKFLEKYLWMKSFLSKVKDCNFAKSEPFHVNFFPTGHNITVILRALLLLNISNGLKSIYSATSTYFHSEINVKDNIYSQRHTQGPVKNLRRSIFKN